MHSRNLHIFVLETLFTSYIGIKRRVQEKQGWYFQLVITWPVKKWSAFMESGNNYDPNSQTTGKKLHKLQAFISMEYNKRPRREANENHFF